MSAFLRPTVCRLKWTKKAGACLRRIHRSNEDKPGRQAEHHSTWMKGRGRARGRDQVFRETS